jgi:hypothetical protein
MLRAFFTALFVLLFVRFAVWTARLLTGGRRDDEIPSGSGAGRRFEGGDGGDGSGVGGARGASRRRGSRRVSPGEIEDVPFTEVPPPESTKRM